MAFQKVSCASLNTIRPILESQLPASAMMLNLVDTSLLGKYGDDDPVDIYAFDDGSPLTEDNLFLNVILRQERQDPFTIVFPPRTVTDEMLDAFTKLYDWNRSQEFGAVPLPFSQHLDKIFRKQGGSGSFKPCADMFLPRDVAFKLDLNRDELQSEFEVDKLIRENASQVNKFWRYGSDAHDISIGQAIDAFGGAGVFKKSVSSDLDNRRSNTNLVSWIVFLRLGTLNALYTLEEYRGKGLGSWTMEAASKYAAEQAMIPLCEIEPYNIQSRRLVEKIGYQFIHDVNWIQYKPGGG